MVVLYLPVLSVVAADSAVVVHSTGFQVQVSRYLVQLGCPDSVRALVPSREHDSEIPLAA